MRSSLEATFDRAALHRSGLLPFRDMVLADRGLDVEGLKASFVRHSAAAALARAAAEEGGNSTDAGDSAAAARSAPVAAELSVERFAAGDSSNRQPPVTSEDTGAAAPAEPAPVTLESFQKLLVSLSDQIESMRALPAFSDVGAVRVDAARLKAALLPWPERQLGELREMLPQLASGESFLC